MADTSEIRKGLALKFNNDIYTVVEFLHVKPGKGAAFVRTKLKSLTTGRVLENTFPSGAKIETVRVERRTYQYLYKEGDSYMMMDTETFDQVPVEEFKINAPKFLRESDTVQILFNTEDETILTVEQPDTVILEVTYTEPGIKGDTATNTLKPATVEGGAEVRVPLFVGIGDRIKINTEDGTYMERAKE